MILSNVEILKGLKKGLFSIDPLAGSDPSQSPFNTSAVDLRLGNEILVPHDQTTPTTLDLSKPGIAGFLDAHADTVNITPSQPFILKPNKLVLGRTIETVAFPIHSKKKICYSARVEGKSSLARCGILVHFTAPTIHSGFTGSITLEIINLGIHEFLLKPNMFVCQLIIEEVKGSPVSAPNQFSGQSKPSGRKK